jgi:hypothetical protein
MYNHQRPDNERVRIELRKSTLNHASCKAKEDGKSLSEYIQTLVDKDLNIKDNQ